MSEETFTISASDFMSFPPTFGNPIVPEKENWLKRLKRFNLFRFFKEMPQRAAIRRYLEMLDDSSVPAEVFILTENDRSSKEISELIQSSFFNLK